jgi:hypothetical protein
MIAKTVKMNLSGLNGNAFNLLGAFQTNARQQGWNEIEINSVIQAATSTNYAHLLETLQAHIDLSDEGEAGDA